MHYPSAAEVTRLLQAWSAGDKQALSKVVPVVYRELRRLAYKRISLENKGASLQPTALINELYLRLVETDGLSFRNRSQFFSLAAQMMRHILVDAARARSSAKRGGDKPRFSFEENFFAAPGKDREIVALDDALQSLAQSDPRKARAVELRFFGGLTIEETAAVLDVSVQTVRRDWVFAQAWLAKSMAAETARST